MLEHFGTEKHPRGDDGGKLTFENLKTCRELTWVFYETLRLYPLVPINGRVAVKDTVLPRGGGKDGKR